MAKKSVAAFRGKGKVTLAKVILPTRNEKTGAYSFREEMIPQDQVKDFLKNNGF